MQARVHSSSELRKALGKFATGVTVVTTRAADGSPDGITVNWFASVSLDPPLVLWCLGLGAASSDTFRLASQHLINVLAADQAELAVQFATRGVKRFDGVRWSATDTGLPVCATVSFAEAWATPDILFAPGGMGGTFKQESSQTRRPSWCR